MAKAEYAVVDGKTRKIKKKYAVVDGKTKKIKKEYVVVGGKTRLCWSENGLKLVGFPVASGGTAYAQLFSEDGKEWVASTTNLTYQLSSVINVNGVLYGINEIYYAGSQYIWYLYKSMDGGITWTQVTNMTGLGGGYIIRYLNGYLIVIGSYNSAGTTTGAVKSVWHSNDMGATWISGVYTLNTIAPTGGTEELEDFSKPLDFRYGTVGGKTGYYLLIENRNKYNSFVYRFDSIYAQWGEFVGGSGYNNMPLWNKGALSIKDNTLRIIGCNTNNSFPNTYCYKITDIYSTITHVKTFQYEGLGVVASNSSYIVATCGTKSFRFDGTTVTEGGSVGSQSAANAGTFAASFVNGTRVIAYKSDSSASSGYIMYSDDYGTTWTIISATNLSRTCKALCSITDSYY